MSLATPIAFIIFNRPELTARVFEAIAAVRPRQLLVIADGARSDRPGELERCMAAREVIKRVNWNCEVRTDFSPVNLGCGKRVASGLDWVFGQCEEVIVLEDDCLPCEDFFRFCESLLHRYRNDQRIMHIGGNNFHGNKISYPDSYYFTRFPHIWGWASWRRAWQHYDFEMENWPQTRDKDVLSQLFADRVQELHFGQNFEEVYSDRLDTWDVQWTYALLMRGGMAINPARNLVSNLGFGVDATHTHGDSWMGRIPTEPLGDLSHPASVIEHRTADALTMSSVFNIGKSTTTLPRKLCRALRRSFRRAIRSQSAGADPT